MKVKIGDKCYVIDWGKHYSELERWNNDEKEMIFPIKTEIPSYSGINHHWKFNYEPNLTQKGTVNKREPKRLVSKEPVYKDYKWEVLEIFKHPKAGKLYYDLDEYTQEQLDNWKNYLYIKARYTEENLLLLASTHTDKDWMRCYIVIEESGVSELTPKQYEDMEFNAFIEANLNKWDRDNLNKKDIPERLISKFYDSNDNVLFGSSFVKGLVSYNYLEGKYSKDGKPIYLSCTISYGSKGNSELKEEDKHLIKPFKEIKRIFE